MMELFLSADIEGTCGIESWDEAEIGNAEYQATRARMTREVNAVCEACHAEGWNITVRDAHDSARNLIPEELDQHALLLRGWVGDIWCMMSGIDRKKYDSAAFTGYRSAGYTDGNSLAHTMSRRFLKVMLNGEILSEFRLNAYIAAHFGVPVVFLSGDRALCKEAKRYIPAIYTVCAKEGVHGATLSRHPSLVTAEINEISRQALSAEHMAACKLALPEHFCLSVTYRDTDEAYRNSFYPGASLSDAKTVSFCTDDFYELIRCTHFILW